MTARSTTGSEGPEQVATDREAGAPLTVTAKSPMSTLWQERGLVKMTETTLDPGAAITAFIAGGEALTITVLVSSWEVAPLLSTARRATVCHPSARRGAW